MNTRDIREAELESLDKNGVASGIDGRGNKVQVRGGLPGERVCFAVEHVGKDRTAYGTVQDVLRPSPDRVDPGCPQYLACGGCDYLHIGLPLQRDMKRQRVADALGMELQDVLPTVASPRDFGYRALAKLVLGPDRILGSYRPRSHDVQDMVGCRVHAPEAEAIVDAARAFMKKVQVRVRYLVVRASLHEGRSVVTMVARSTIAPGLNELAEHLDEREDVARVVLHINEDPGDAIFSEQGDIYTLYDDGPVEERVGPVHQNLEAGAFAQVNPSAAAELYRVSAEGAQAKGLRVLDLFAGSGGVGLALAADGAIEVLAVESVEAATDAAIAAAEAQGVSEVFDAKTAEVMTLMADLLPGDFDVVVLNPPRKGAGAAVMQEVLRLAPKRIVYISCNPDSLARDVSGFGAAGYEVQTVTPVDLFPHTRHIETVLVASHKSDCPAL